MVFVKGVVIFVHVSDIVFVKVARLKRFLNVLPRISIKLDERCQRCCVVSGFVDEMSSTRWWSPGTLAPSTFQGAFQAAPLLLAPLNSRVLSIRLSHSGNVRYLLPKAVSTPPGLESRLHRFYFSFGLSPTFCTS